MPTSPAPGPPRIIRSQISNVNGSFCAFDRLRLPDTFRQARLTFPCVKKLSLTDNPP